MLNLVVEKSSISNIPVVIGSLLGLYILVRLTNTQTLKGPIEAGLDLHFLHKKIVFDTLRNPLNRIPGPRVARWTNLVHDYYLLKGQQPYYVHNLHKKYGPIVRISPDRVDICDAYAVREIHKTHTKFPKTAFYRQLVSGNIHTMFSTTDPQFHGVRRRLLASPISDSSLSHLVPQISNRVEYTIQRIAEEINNRGAADIFKWWLFMATDIIGELSFGESFKMLEAGKPTQYSMDLARISSLQPVRTTFPTLIKFGAYLPLPFFKSAAASGKRIGMYAHQSVQRYVNHLAENPENPKPTLFTKMFDMEKSGMSQSDIRDEAQGYIVAGSDTTAITLTYLVYSVCKNPEVQTKLVEELSQLPEPVSDRDLRDLPYLNNIITETLRLHTAVPFGLPRAVPPEGAQFNEHVLPGGVTVSTQSYSLHRDPKIFPDPERFKPERWENTTKEMKDVSLPFGGGSRICIGMHLARIELRLATALFFRRFPEALVSTKEGMNDDDMIMKCFFLMAPSGHRCLIEG